MKFSERWLKQWVPVSVPTGELCEQLTNAGLEVEGTERVAPEFSGVVLAEVVGVRPHPNAHDHLSVCQVQAGDGIVEVVCGAPNVRQGMKTALAVVGAELPNGVQIRRAELRGMASEGMLCSEQELGLGNDASGLLELDADFGAAFDVAGADVRPGVDARQALALDDVTIELDLTPNRGDCLGLRGLAREVGLLNRLAVTAPDIVAVSATIDTVFPVQVDNPAGCPRYLGRVVEGVDCSRRAPLWLRERLRRCGLRSIDPVVDVTNYVLLELGQPMHAFDLDALHGGIVVRNGRDGEELAMLDGRGLAVDENALLITDHRGPVALAGVMGGERSGVGTATRNVFLECAFFAPLTVAATARRYAMHTDAAHRYERGVDHDLQASAMQRATALLLAIAGGRAGPVVEAGDAQHLPAARSVALRKARLAHLVGEEIPDADVERILTRLELAPTAQGTGAAKVWTTTAPSHRFDIEREEDLVEEVLRIHGYNAVASRVPATALALGSATASKQVPLRIADLLVDLGYSEAVTYSFVDPALADVLDPQGDPLRLVNPVSSDHAVMRTNLLPGLVGALRTNLTRQADRIRLFEVGQCFATDQDAPNGVGQATVCGGILYGWREAESWAHDNAAVDFFDVKGDVERILALGGGEAEFVRAADAVLHPGQSAVVQVDGQPIGRLGRLHPEVEAALHLPSGVWVFELRMDALSSLGDVRRRRDAALSRFPAVRRDMALVMDQQIAAARIEAIVRRVLGTLVTDFRLFDVYVGEGIEPNQKSVAVGVTLQHPARTLRDEEVNQHFDRTLAALAAEVGARLR